MTAQTEIRTKNVYSEIEPRADGLRILATRIRGHGLPKDRYDVWMANLGPSERLLSKFRSGAISWPEFRRAYKAELLQSDKIDRSNSLVKNKGQKFTLRLLQQLALSRNVTLLCHCAEDEKECHRHVLKKILDGKI